jgi:AcrR family transcriptional regulator
MYLANKPKTQRGEETLEKICKSAEELFSTNGYYNTSINDITSRANIAPGTYYIYFKDKKSVFQYLVSNLSHELRKEIKLRTASLKDRYTEEFIGLKVFFEFIRTHSGLYKIIWEAQFVDMDIFVEYYETFAERYIKGIKTAQEKGEMKDIDPKCLAYSLIGIANFIGLKWIIFDDKEVDDNTINEVMKFIKAGAFTIG